MANDITLPGTGIAVDTEEIGGAHIQRIKIATGLTGVDSGNVADNNGLPIKYAHSPSLDAFGRLRVSNPVLLIDEKNVAVSPALGNFASGGASYSKPANRASFYLTTGGIGSVARRQSRQRAVYQPGKSQSIQITFCMGTLTAGITQRAGYFDDESGIFFEADGTTLSFVVRSKKTGSVVDTKIPRASWLDPLDGTGASGITLDPTKFQILAMDFGWLGGGAIRFGFQLNGIMVPAAEYIHSNVYAGVHMSNPNQPLRWEILAISSAAVVTLEAICGKVDAEGGFQNRGIGISHDSDGVVKAINGALTYGEMMAIRLTAVGILYGVSIPRSITVLCATAGQFQWELWLNATGMTGGAWTTPSASITEQNTTRTGTYTGGVKIASGYCIDSGFAADIQTALTTGLGYDINAAAADVLSLRIMNFANNNSYAASIVMQQEA